MDNIVWVIVASAVIIALAGVLLFIGSGTLGDVGDNANNITDNDPWDFTGIEEPEDDGSSTDTSTSDGSSDGSEDDNNGGIGAPGLGGG